MRADAARNRAAIIDAASCVLAEQGSAVDVREIARLSGVGMGTLYRHFPTKDDLLATVLHQEFLAWADCARRTASCTEDPWTALSDFFDQALTRQAKHRALMQCYAQNWCAARSEYTLQVRPVIDALLDRAQAAGLIRAGVTGEDLALLLAGLGQAVQLTEPDRPGMWRRSLRICLDGLRSDHPEPLPGAPAVVPATASK
jgi:AcrR family transcriptional regulator